MFIDLARRGLLIAYYGEKKSLAFLYKLAEETRKLEEVCRQVIELTKRYEKEYLTKKE